MHEEMFFFFFFKFKTARFPQAFINFLHCWNQKKLHFTRDSNPAQNLETIRHILMPVLPRVTAADCPAGWLVSVTHPAGGVVCPNPWPGLQWAGSGSGGGRFAGEQVLGLAPGAVGSTRALTFPFQVLQSFSYCCCLFFLPAS